MQELLPALRRWLDRGEDVALATVVATRRSAPRPVGSVLGVSARGELAGSVSAGCVENEVYAEAREVLAGGAARQRTYGITDEQALGVGLPCGGEIDVYVARADAGLLRNVVEEIGRGRVVTVEPSGDGLAVASRPAPRLVVVGAIDTAEALCRGAKSLGWTAIVVDPRERWATAERVPSADEIAVEWPTRGLPSSCSRTRTGSTCPRCSSRSRATRSSSERSGRGGRRSGDAKRCSSWVSRRKRSAGSTARSGSTSAPRRRPKRPSRSSPRSWPRAQGETAARSASAPSASTPRQA